MRIRYVSDAHIDLNGGAKKFPLFSLEKDEIAKDDVLILAGDCINEPTHPRFGAFLKMCAARWRNVVLIPGNHEYYVGSSMQTTDKYLRRVCEEMGVIFLNKDVAMIDGVPFIGCTLWSNLSKEAFFQLWWDVGDSNIKIDKDGSTEFWSYGDYVGLHNEHKQWLTETLKAHERSEKRVVITHHSPTFEDASHSKYKNSITNTFFMNELDHLFENLKEDQKGLWIFGHTHWNTYQERKRWIATSNCIGYRFANEDVGKAKTGGVVEL